MYPEQGRYAEAEQLNRRALKIRESALPADDPKLAQSLNNLAIVYKDQNRYAEAEPLYRRALQIWEKALGSEHPDVATALGNLAALYEDQGRYVEAEPLYRRALQIQERAKHSHHPDLAKPLNNLAGLFVAQAKYAEAEPLFQRALTIWKTSLGPEHPLVAIGINNLAQLYSDQGRYAEAEALYRQALQIRQKALGSEHADVALSLSNLGNVCEEQAKYAEAESLHQQALKLRERVLGTDHLDVAASLNNLGSLYMSQGRYAEVEPLYQRALEIKKKAWGSGHPDVALYLSNLGHLYWTQARYTESERLHRQALAIREKALGPQHPVVANSINHLATLYAHLGAYAEAEPLYRRTIEIAEKSLGSDHPDLADRLGNLASMYADQGRQLEAEQLYQQALRIHEKAFGPNHPDVALSLNNLGNLYVDEGRFAEAEWLYQRAFRIWETTSGPNHPDVALILKNLGDLYHLQGRYAEAEPRYQRVLEIWEKVLGPDHPSVASVLSVQALVNNWQGRFLESEQLHQRALAIREKAFGPDHTDVAGSLHNLGFLYSSQRRYVEAEPLYRRALQIYETTWGPQDPSVAVTLKNLAALYLNQGRHADAEAAVDRAITILAEAKFSLDMQRKCYLVRAELYWSTDRREAAVADLKRALDIIETMRPQFSGGERERAEAFASFSDAYEQMIAWQTELNDPAAAFEAVERSRARALIDQLNTSNIDLLAGLPTAESKRLRQQESVAKQRLASLEKQLELLPQRKDLTPDQQQVQQDDLHKQLPAARQAIVDAYAGICNASPAYRQMVAQDFRPAPLEQVQTQLAGPRSVVLQYVLGNKASYLFVIPPVGQSLRIEKLSLLESQGQLLGVQPGPLTADVLQQVFSNSEGTGVLQLLQNPAAAEPLNSKLAVLWQVLVPEPERTALTDGRITRLVVIPDGPLALLPLEALIVELGDKPRYLLDAGPPIMYAPSSTLLLNLQQVGTSSASDRKPVLTVGDIDYGGHASAASPSAGTVGELAAGSRWASVRGQLPSLPFTRDETTWVAEAFREQGLATGQLLKGEATEERVRFNVSGRRIIHLACHGLVDQSYGNLFGALALTPGAASHTDPADDGFLTLAEIYALNLKGCELAILSACETNYGPQQQGEGTWSLSRGFLVSGSRRVVASSWIVDDEAAAHLVSIFSSHVAQGWKDRSLDHAMALRDAKRQIRQQEKWESPYYWASMVLVGPR